MIEDMNISGPRRVNPNSWMRARDVVRAFPGLSKETAKGLIERRNALPGGCFTSVQQFASVARSTRSIDAGLFQQIMQRVNLPGTDTLRSARIIALQTHHADESGFLPLEDKVRSLLCPIPALIIFVREACGGNVEEMAFRGISAEECGIKPYHINSEEIDYRRLYDFANGPDFPFESLSKRVEKKIEGGAKQKRRQMMKDLDMLNPFTSAIFKFAIELKKAGAKLRFIDEDEIGGENSDWQEKQFQAWMKYEKSELLWKKGRFLFSQGEYQQALPLLRSCYQLLTQSCLIRDELLLEEIRVILRQYPEATLVIPRGDQHFSFFSRLGECGEDYCILKYPIFEKYPFLDPPGKIARRILEGKPVSNRLLAEDMLLNLIGEDVCWRTGWKPDSMVCKMDPNEVRYMLHGFTKRLSLSSIIAILEKSYEEKRRIFDTFIQIHKKELPKELLEYFSAIL